MKKLFALFIILPLLVSLDFPWVNWDFNWDWKIDFDWESLLDKFKSAIPDFMKKMKDKVQTFLKKTEEERNKFLKNLDKKWNRTTYRKYSRTTSKFSRKSHRSC